MGEHHVNPAFAALPIAAFVATTSALLVDVSVAWEEKLGLPTSASLGRTLWDCLGGDLADQLRERWPEVLASSGPLALEGTVAPPALAPLHAPLCWHVEIRRSGGQVVGLLRDVTERWQRAQMQRRLLAWSRRLQQAASFGELVDLAEAEAKEVTPYRSFWLFVRPEPDSPVARRLASSGRASAAQWEHLPEIVIADDAVAMEVCEGDHTVIVADARTDPRTNKEMVAALGSRTIVNIPLLLLDQNLGAFGMGSFNEEGVRLPTPFELEVVETMATHLAVAAGRLRFLAERERAEKARRELELRMLRMQNLESLGVLAGGVAHDVNNLMTAVLGNLELGRRGVQPGTEADTSLHHAQVAASRTADLAGQMLAYAGKGVLRRESADLGPLVRETLGLARVNVPKKVELKLEDAPQCVVEADLTQLRQLVMNLVTNAAEAIGNERPGTVSVTLTRTELDAAGLADSLLDTVPPGAFVVLEVSDDGAGMDEDTRTRLFDPFFTTKVTGRGLGMSAALGIVRGHGGALWVESEKGRGSTFRIALPAAAIKHEPAVLPPAPRPSDARLVLVAEDDATIRRITRITLQRAGFETLEARDGKEALELFHTHAERLGMVLLDSLMPELSGKEVMHEIRSARPDFPIVLCSGYVHDPSMADDHQPTAVLAKPWEPAELVRVVETTLSGGR